MFSVGGVRLNLNCSGQGSPTVVLESGLGGAGVLDWILVQPGVDRFTRVCSYDRAGYGWSESSREPRTSEQIAQELRSLLDAANEKGPFVLEGHSFGAYNVRVSSGLYPEEVAGIVLVDGSHPDEERRLNAILTPAQLALHKQSQLSTHWDEITEALKLRFGAQRLPSLSA